MTTITNMTTGAAPQTAADSDAAVRAAADQLWQAHAAHAPCPPVRTLIGEADPLAAYRVQEINTRRWIAEGRRLVGRKIGLTSRAVQQQLGVGEPDFGMLFADMAVAEGEEIDLGRVLQPKIEAEIALVLAHPLPHERHTVADLIRATAYALPAAEIVGSRVAGWDIRLADTVADNASSGLFALGSRPVKLERLDLIGCGMVMERRGEQVSLGTGAACLGNPLHAALWLADTMVRVGRPLQAGDIVMTGALGPMVPVAAGDVFDLEIEGLGRLSTRFASAREQAA